jgi:hypothetical protein
MTPYVGDQGVVNEDGMATFWATTRIMNNALVEGIGVGLR